ncbi:MAG: hypothetical protein KME20_09030 [Kaiparowitsia implicata GSE-PSE-MK54-09C]|jgi:hypothetical protein|nr:hypothetical protein [Kaiparowitsia implicata GSE-PSE-MK54-09C]
MKSFKPTWRRRTLIKKSQNRDRPTTTNQFPNVTAVKIFENVDNLQRL